MTPGYRAPQSARSPQPPRPPQSPRLLQAAAAPAAPPSYAHRAAPAVRPAPVPAARPYLPAPTAGTAGGGLYGPAAIAARGAVPPTPAPEPRLPMSEPKLPAAVLARFQELATRIDDYDRGAPLILDGEVADFVLLIESGMVKITTGSAGGATKLLAFRGRHQLIGDFGCLDGNPRWGTVEAVTPVRVRRIPGERFLETVRSDIDICFAVLQCTVARVREADDKLGENGEYSSGERVVRLLARLAVICREDERAPGAVIPVAQAALAGCAGVARETVCRTVTALKARGIAHAGRERIVVDDLDGLIELFRQTEIGGSAPIF